MAEEKLFQVGVKALITSKKGNILVLFSGDWHLKNQTEHWDIPGGRIQEGQTALQTLRREVEEETGIKEISKIEPFSGVISNFKDIPVGEHNVGLALIIYKVGIPDSSEVILSPEHSNYEWVGAKEAARRLAYKYPQEFTTAIAKMN
jgi:8-oxo-dGTP pyrophosphatase MutT (NUDIX family)